MDIMKLSIDECWKKIEEAMKKHPTPYKELNAVYQFELIGDQGGTYQLVLSDGKMNILRDQFKEPNCILQMKESDFKKFLQGKMNSAAAYMMGKLKLQGSMGLALKLERLLEQYEL